MQTKTNRVDNLKSALAEVRANKHVFSSEAYSQIVFALLDRIRVLQTVQSSSVSDERDEIRLVTVMFIDVQDSTELAQELSRELARSDHYSDSTDVWKRIIAGCHERLSKIIQEWDGEVGQLLGDGMLCFFGAHHSRSDDAIRAVSAALEAQEAMMDYARILRERHPYGWFNFAIRIGISTGRVVVGMVGGESKKEFLALGPTTNLASRLQTICPPGNIFIDAETYRRIRNHFLTFSQRPATLKGFDEPVEHYAVLERRRRPATRFTSTGIAGIETPFVGRSMEIDFMTAISERANEDRLFHVVTIYGETGAGKSRLLQEFAFKLADRAFIQVHMVADYEKRTASYKLLRNLLAKSCNLTEETAPEITRQRIIDFVKDSWPEPDAEAVAAVMGYLCGYGFMDSPHVQPLKRGGPGQDKLAFSWLARWFRGLAETGTLLIVVDNLQWADTSSIDLLEYLAHDLKDFAGVIIAAARPELRAEKPYYMRSVERHSALVLENLDTASMRELIASILNQVNGVSENLTNLIVERSEGNPLFIEEFLATLFDSGVFESTGTGEWRVNKLLYETTISKLPSGLVGVLQARLDDLPPVARHLLQVAAVAGQNFWAGAVASMTDVILSTTLNDLVTRGLIVEVPDSIFENEREYQFRNTLYREVAYNMLPNAKREEYHRKLAGWMAARISNRPEYMPALAEQYELGTQYDNAMSIYLTAAEYRLERGLLDEALALIEKGLAPAGKVPREVALPVTCKLWTARGQAYNALNRFDEASAACQSALRLLNELPIDQFLNTRIRASRMLALAYRSLGNYTGALEVLQQAYEYVPPNDTEELATVLRAFGTLFMVRGRLNQSLAYMERAHSYAEDLGDPRHLAGTMTQLGLIAYNRGNLATSIDYFDHTLTINRKRENIHYQIMDLRNIGAVYLALFAYELANEAFSEAVKLQTSLQYRDPLLDAFRGQCLIGMNQPLEGIHLLRESADRGHKDAYSAFLLRLLYISGLARTGDYVQCREKGQLFVEDVEAHNPLLHGRGKLWLGIAAHALGEPGAIKLLEEALQSELTFGGLYVWTCYQALGLASTHPDSARALYGAAMNTLNAIGSSLHTRPDLQKTLLNNSFVKSIMTSAEE